MSLWSSSEYKRTIPLSSLMNVSPTRMNQNWALRLTQKIGGLFNTDSKRVVTPDWPTNSDLSPTMITLGIMDDFTEFIFQSGSGEGTAVGGVAGGQYDCSVMGSDVLSSDTADITDYFEGFTQLGGDNYDYCMDMNGSVAMTTIDTTESVAMTATDMAESVSMTTTDTSCIADLMNLIPSILSSTPSCTLSVPQLSSILPVAPSRLHPTADTRASQPQSFTITPDHSYSTIKQAPGKRKLTEANHVPNNPQSLCLLNPKRKCYDDDEDNDVVNSSLVKRSKYLERRTKNNIASKRSRETRKNKFVEMDEQTGELERANEELRKRIVQLEELTMKMKEALVHRLSTSSSR